jgi:hypothetical protein
VLLNLHPPSRSVNRQDVLDPVPRCANFDLSIRIRLSASPSLADAPLAIFAAAGSGPDVAETAEAGAVAVAGEFGTAGDVAAPLASVIPKYNQHHAHRKHLSGPTFTACLLILQSLQLPLDESLE